MKMLDSQLSKRVLSHRLETSRTGNTSKHLIRHKIEQWKIFEGISKYSLEDNKYLLVTDVQNYFENISITDIEKSFQHLLNKSLRRGTQKVQIRCAIDTLIRCLKYWTFNGKNGLAQNRDASHFISNVVMCQFDELMLSKGLDYYRYVDDIRVICHSKPEARKHIKFMISELRNLGLTVNPQKTIIFDKNNLDAVNSIFPSDNETIERIDSMFRSRSRHVIARSLPLIANYTKELIQEGKTQDRTFRFCIDRLEKLLRCDSFDLGVEYFDSIAEEVINSLEEHAVTSDKFISYLSAGKLSCTNETKLINYISNRETAIFAWQNFLIWRLFSLNEIKDDRLVSLAQQLISQEYTPEKNAAIIYLAKHYPALLSTDIWHEFKTNKCFLFQRAVLLALHERSLKHDFKEYSPHMLHTVRNTGSRVNGSSLHGVYIKAPPPFKFSDLFDQISQYE